MNDKTWVYADYDGRVYFAKTKRDAMDYGSGFDSPVGRNRIKGVYEVYSKSTGDNRGFVGRVDDMIASGFHSVEDAVKAGFKNTIDR